MHMRQYDVIEMRLHLVQLHTVINFRALLPHMYGDINKLFQCFVELVFFYFLICTQHLFQVTTLFQYL